MSNFTLVVLPIIFDFSAYTGQTIDKIINKELWRQTGQEPYTITQLRRTKWT